MDKEIEKEIEENQTVSYMSPRILAAQVKSVTLNLVSHDHPFEKTIFYSLIQPFS